MAPRSSGAAIFRDAAVRLLKMRFPLLLMVRSRAKPSVSNHGATFKWCSHLSRRRAAAPHDEVSLTPHGEEPGEARRLEPWRHVQVVRPSFETPLRGSSR